MDTGEYNRTFYSVIFNNCNAAKYYRIQGKKIKSALKLFESHKNGKILDIGCGDGFISSLIASRTGAKMYGVDISATSISNARKKGVKAKVANIDAGLPFGKEIFDAIFCGDVLEHIQDTEKLIENANKMLKKNGYMIISVPNIASWYNRGFLLLGMMPTWVESSLRSYTGNPFIKEGAGHIHAFTKRSLSDLLIMKGFSIEKITGSPLLGDGSRSRWKERLWNATDSFFARKATLASTIIIKAKKSK